MYPLYAIVISVISLIPLTIILWIIYALLNARFSALSRIPGWQLRNPIFGTMADSDQMELLQRYRYEYENFGTIYKMYLPLSLLYVVITEPSVAKHVLQTNSKNFIRPPLTGMGVFRRLVGQSSILLSNGNIHKIQRALATRAFTPSSIRQITPIFLECGRQLVDRLSLIADSGLIDIRCELSKCTLDAIGRSAFGYDFHCVSGNDHMISAASSIQMVMDYVTNFQIWYYLPYADWLPIKVNRDFNRGLSQLHAIAERMIDERNEILRGQDQECKNLLDVMITSGEEKSIDRSSLRDQLMTFLMAGHETTSLALTYTLYFLCKHPSCQEDCRREISQLEDAELIYESEKLKYTKSVIQESLRLLPPVFALARQSIEPDQLGQYAIPGGTNVAVLVTQMHRLPTYWGEDADEFKPDRFLDGDKIPWEAYMPFGEGMRKCIGYKFALNEIAALLALLLKNFVFRLDPIEMNMDMDFYGIVTMLPARTIRLLITKL